MVWYFVKLLILLPMIAGLAFGVLWLWRKYQPGLMQGQADRAVRVVDAVPLGAFGKLAVVEFHGKTLLLSVTRGRIERIAESDRRAD
ncbi:MAG: flagellar biosynthetic protein FliO [Sphingobium sp.]